MTVSAPVTEPMLSVRGLRRVYDGVAAVDGVDLDVGAGEIFGLLGPNGAGKTTTLEIIEGLRKATGGEVHIAGIDAFREPRRVKAMIGVQLQEAAYFDRLTLVELIEFLGSLYGVRPDAMALLNQVNLEDQAKKQARHLSGGQRQRLGVATALVNDPRVLFLDEPTSGLDPHARRNLWRIVRDQRDRGRTLILTTHYIEEAEALCDRVAIMDAGKILACDSPAALIDELLATGFKRDVQVRRAELEDVFLHLTGKTIEEEEG